MQKSNFLKNYEELIFVSDEPQRADVIFIPGNSLPDMAERAAALWKKGYADLLVPSGKYSVLVGRFQEPLKKKELYSGAYETEWEFLKDVLVKNQVPEEVILKEDRATYTYENALFSKEVLEKQQIEVKKAIICCKAFHARRCKMYYELVFPQTQFYICPVDTGINRENWYQSEEGIQTVLGEVERCGTQFYQILEEIKG